MERNEGRISCCIANSCRLGGNTALPIAVQHEEWATRLMVAQTSREAVKSVSQIMTKLILKHSINRMAVIPYS